MGKTISRIRFEHFIAVTLPNSIAVMAIILAIVCVVVRICRLAI